MSECIRAVILLLFEMCLRNKSEIKSLKDWNMCLEFLAPYLILNFNWPPKRNGERARSRLLDVFTKRRWWEKAERVKKRPASFASGRCASSGQIRWKEPSFSPHQSWKRKRKNTHTHTHDNMWLLPASCADICSATYSWRNDRCEPFILKRRKSE